MLVYGDVEHTTTFTDMRVGIEDMLAQAHTRPRNIESHTALVAAFIKASELVQGLVDCEFEDRGIDARSPVHDSGMKLLLTLARYVQRSWHCHSLQELSATLLLDALSLHAPSSPIRVKRAEGHAFYALYPEGYLEAAMRSDLGPKTHVVGIRSIGTGLSAIVASAIDASPPITLRPVGHPFQRQVRIDPALTAELTADKQATFAIVDEGPGLSGSSFGAVAEWLEDAGIRRERIHFFPSHNGDLGPQASSLHRARWREASRHVVKMDDLLLCSPHHLLIWVEDIIGRLKGPLEDISGGAWRSKRYPNEAEWPAADIQHERRKFLAYTQDATWLIKFIGLGEGGTEKYQRAVQLSKASYTPEVAGYRHGFLIERWHDAAKNLDQFSVDRDRLIERVGCYLGYRARHFSGESCRGATLSELRHMSCYNTQQALGDTAARMLDCSLPRTEDIEDHIRKVETDNRMHAWEWLISGEHFIKTDALDHGSTHDLIGHQDITWDVAGAIIELGLSEREAFHLCEIIQRVSGYPVHPGILTFMRLCYPAFQMGSHIMAAQALGEGRESLRLRRAADHYASLLLHCG